MFGRGTFDNKLGVTALTTIFLRLRAEVFVPTRDLIIAFTGDEESGMRSTELLVNKTILCQFNSYHLCSHNAICRTC
ncbi:M20/M25/M40 family metallo-hydrolase [Glaciecola petra]|uniref:M20/M25/M40 family metallo-hydrolase n=1 Tax=Glaciecola petra TaxID=3075602 RepID=UPI003D76C332